MPAYRIAFRIASCGAGGPGAGKEAPVEKLHEISQAVFLVGNKCMVRDCPNCGRAVPVNGPVKETACPNCQSRVAIPEQSWLLALRTGVNLAMGSKPVMRTVPMLRGRSKLEVERTAQVGPTCVHCGEPLQILPEMWQRPEFSATCGKCGRRVDFLPPPVSMATRGAKWTHFAASETDGTVPTDAVRVDTGRGGETQTAVVMGCPSCGGTLKIAADAQRTTSCEFCGSSVYLPDDLWCKLHPAKKALAWTTVHSFTPADLRAAGLASVIGTLLLIVLVAGGLTAGLCLGVYHALVVRDAPMAAGIICLLLVLALAVGIIAVLVSSIGKARAYYRKAAELGGR